MNTNTPAAVVDTETEIDQQERELRRRLEEHQRAIACLERDLQELVIRRYSRR